MAKSLITKCPDCGKVTQLFDLRRCQPEELGNAIRQAATDGLDVELTEGPLEPGCECPTAGEAPITSKASGSGQSYRFNLMQLMLAITVVAAGLAIFRHPISLLFDDGVMSWAAVPWSMYGWFFFGTEFINPKKLVKNPMGIIVFLPNLVVAVILPIVFFAFATSTISHLWQLAGNAGRKPAAASAGRKNSEESPSENESELFPD